MSFQRSFLLGLTLASATWLLVFYLYLQILPGPSANLTSSPYASSKFPLDKSEEIEKSLFYVPLKDRFDEKGQGSQSKSKWGESFKNVITDEHENDKTKKYKNSRQLIDRLKSEVGYTALGIIRNQKDRQVHDEGFKTHAFNVLVSERIGYSFREIPDTRNEGCSFKDYPLELPQASIIICFYNEELTALIRTVNSVLNRSRPQDIHEILLVDDSSTLGILYSVNSALENKNLTSFLHVYTCESEDKIADLHDGVLEYMKRRLPAKVTLLKTPKNEGLIRARVFGARHATGDVLVFLDSHVEPNIGWLEPLLTSVQKNPKTIAIPMIDVINPETFVYTPSPLVKGGFNWGLHYKWDNVIVGQDFDFTEPISSPTMAGGLFAIDAKVFKDMGEYDEGMRVWGGENLEISFRFWMCGGKINIIPCSRVGHVFRRRRPYGASDDNSVLRNSARVAAVWMDEYKERFFKENPRSTKIDFGKVDDRLELRKKLNCSSFQWYLENIYPEILAKDLPGGGGEQKIIPWNKRSRTYKSTFKIQLSSTELCIRARDFLQRGSTLILGKCVSTKSKQLRWSFTSKKELVLSELLCLESGDSFPKLAKCSEQGGSQEFDINVSPNILHKEIPIFNLASGLCLGVESDKITVGSPIKMSICGSTESHDKFDLIPIT